MEEIVPLFIKVSVRVRRGFGHPVVQPSRPVKMDNVRDCGEYLVSPVKKSYCTGVYDNESVFNWVLHFG